MAGAFRIRHQTARDDGVLERLLDAEEDRPGCEQSFLHADSLEERVTSGLCCRVHDTE
jgi:hypothetical protein